MKYKKGNSNNYQGIKFDSVFNRLKGYHVCQPGLLPCFGYDLLEGIVAFDMFQMIVYFVSKRWFNKKIDSFKYSSHDRKDKPAKIPEKGKGNRIVGGAWQILHTFFKRAMRVLKSYKNVTSTLSEKHKLLQSFLRSGGGLRCELQLNQEHEFHMNLYSENIRKCLSLKKLLSYSPLHIYVQGITPYVKVKHALASTPLC